ncbi:MAG TPA: GAF domain-containing protein [Bryobacteraceae bacterium]|jgi:adenylate cyclase|nr:GAF domain-containing protein [Bryobacteraceae bacterium]
MAAKPSVASTIEQQQIEQMGLLLRVARDVAAQDTLDQMLRSVVEVSTEETGAESGTLFLNDERTGELYSRVFEGGTVREIRMMNSTGVAGHVFNSGIGAIVDDPYSDPRFNPEVDKETGYVTSSLLCAPVRTPKGEVMGVLQVLNKKLGSFTKEDLRLLEEMTSLCSMALHSRQFMDRMQSAREREMKFLDLVAEVTSDLDLGTMLSKVMAEAARMLQADRATLFLNDEKTSELFSRVAMGDSIGEIRMPNHVGISGAVFTSGQTINIPYAYADLRFNPAFDKRTGYFTRSILCVPIMNKAGKVIGVTQVLNRKGGPFNAEDEARLKAFTAQVAMSLESAKLFDQVQQVKNYNESMLQSMSNGVVTLNDEGAIVTCNTAGLRILRAAPGDILNRKAEQYFTDSNAWVIERIKVVEETLQSDISMDAELTAGKEKVSVNLTVQPLMSEEENGVTKKLGTMLMVEDVSGEKRMKSTMSRYMDPRLADQLLSGGEELLGGKIVTGTVLFSDVRNFTPITEELGAQGTVTLLNEYFTLMVDCIQKHGGMLDKFIGDAIMAVFGLPLPHEDDEDRAVRASIGMIAELRRWNAERMAAGKKPIEIGVGLNTDNIVSGNIGSPKRMDYTVIGDGVNLASRLESACKQYGAGILISENTLRKLKGTYRVRDVDVVVVKGKTEPVGVFEVLDYFNEESFPNLADFLGYYRNGISSYRRQDWDKSLAEFNQCLRLRPNDKLSHIYIERSEQMKENPPGDDWNGVWVLKSK